MSTYRRGHHASPARLDPPEGGTEAQGLQEGQSGDVAGTAPLAECGPEEEVGLGGRPLQGLTEELSNPPREKWTLPSLPDRAPGLLGAEGGEQVVT